MTLPDNWFDQLKAAYPKRDGGQGWPIAATKAAASIANGVEFERILKGTRNYAEYCKRKGKVGTELTMQAQRFYGTGQYWDEFADMDLRTPSEIATERAKASLVQRAAKAGFRQPSPGEPDFRYEQALKEEERRQEPRPEPKFQVVR